MKKLLFALIVLVLFSCEQEDVNPMTEEIKVSESPSNMPDPYYIVEGEETVGTCRYVNAHGKIYDLPCPCRNFTKYTWPPSGGPIVTTYQECGW